MEELNHNNEKPKLKLKLVDDANNAANTVQSSRDTVPESSSQDEFIGNRYSGYIQQEAGAYQGTDTYYTDTPAYTKIKTNKLGGIMGIVLWVALLIPIIIFAIAFFSSMMTYDSLRGIISLSSSILWIVCLADAIIYNVTEERRIRLIVVAVLLTLIYPFFRCSAYQGSSGKYWLWLVVFLVALFGSVSKTMQNQQANLPQLSEQESRTIISHFEQLPLENSKTMDSVISASLKNIYYQIYEYTDGSYEVQVIGLGNFKPDGTMIEISSDYTNNTVMVFELPSTMDSYKLTSIYVNGKRVSKAGRQTIWDSVFLNPNSL